MNDYEFTKIAVAVLNQIVRSFTAKRHKESLRGAAKKRDRCIPFRREPMQLQAKFRQYRKMLAKKTSRNSKWHEGERIKEQHRPNAWQNR